MRPGARVSKNNKRLGRPPIPPPPKPLRDFIGVTMVTHQSRGDGKVVSLDVDAAGIGTMVVAFDDDPTRPTTFDHNWFRICGRLLAPKVSP